MPMTDPPPRLRNRFLSDPTEPVQPGDLGRGHSTYLLAHVPVSGIAIQSQSFLERRRAFRIEQTSAVYLVFWEAGGLGGGMATCTMLFLTAYRTNSLTECRPSLRMMLVR
jgi:hypothetical protein